MRKIYIIIIAQSIVVVKQKSLDIVLYFFHVTIFGRKLSCTRFPEAHTDATFSSKTNTKKTADAVFFVKIMANCTLSQIYYFLQPLQHFFCFAGNSGLQFLAQSYHFSGIPGKVSITIIAAAALATRVSLSRSRTSILIVTSLSSA